MMQGMQGAGWMMSGMGLMWLLLLVLVLLGVAALGERARFLVSALRGGVSGVAAPAPAMRRWRPSASDRRGGFRNRGTVAVSPLLTCWSFLAGGPVVALAAALLFTHLLQRGTA